mmetsp:Transcript_26114/g.83377  ORF Transcript_26114/g.83377 Transcript_26114/m.83377 type:complete len:203 (-) Transcript_26114:3544-4152(-)
MLVHEHCHLPRATSGAHRSAPRLSSPPSRLDPHRRRTVHSVLRGSLRASTPLGDPNVFLYVVSLASFRPFLECAIGTVLAVRSKKRAPPRGVPWPSALYDSFCVVLPSRRCVSPLATFECGISSCEVYLFTCPRMTGGLKPGMSARPSLYASRYSPLSHSGPPDEPGGGTIVTLDLVRFHWNRRVSLLPSLPPVNWLLLVVA